MSIVKGKKITGNMVLHKQYYKMSFICQQIIHLKGVEHGKKKRVGCTVHENICKIFFQLKKKILAFKKNLKKNLFIISRYAPVKNKKKMGHIHTGNFSAISQSASRHVKLWVRLYKDSDKRAWTVRITSNSLQVILKL